MQRACSRAGGPARQNPAEIENDSLCCSGRAGSAAGLSLRGDRPAGDHAQRLPLRRAHRRRGRLAPSGGRRPRLPPPGAVLPRRPCRGPRERRGKPCRGTRRGCGHGRRCRTWRRRRACLSTGRRAERCRSSGWPARGGCPPERRSDDGRRRWRLGGSELRRSRRRGLGPGLATAHRCTRVMACCRVRIASWAPAGQGCSPSAAPRRRAEQTQWRGMTPVRPAAPYLDALLQIVNLVLLCCSSALCSGLTSCCLSPAQEASANAGATRPGSTTVIDTQR